MRDIWHGVRLRWIALDQSADSRQMLRMSFDADRRDADLMLRLEHAVRLGSSVVMQHEALFPCRCGRWYPGWYTLSGFQCECRDVNITNFA